MKSYVEEGKVKKAVHENKVENFEKRNHTGRNKRENTNTRGRD
jgi:hypothetical protein